MFGCSLPFKGEVGITLYMNWVHPKDPNSREDVEAAENLRQCKFGWFANPIIGDGDYPAILKQRAKEIARQINYHKESVLPQFTLDEIRENKGKFRGKI